MDAHTCRGTCSLYCSGNLEIEWRERAVPCKVTTTLERDPFSNRKWTTCGCHLDPCVRYPCASTRLCSVRPLLSFHRTDVATNILCRWWGYSSHWNLLDLPGVVFPTGQRLAPNDNWETLASLPPARNPVDEFVRNQWNPETYTNAPISLQLIGRRHNEEKLLAILNQIECLGVIMA